MSLSRGHLIVRPNFLVIRTQKIVAIGPNVVYRKGVNFNRFCIAALVLALAVPASAITRRDNVTDQQMKDNSTAFDGCGQLIISNLTNDPRSCYLVGDRFVLTAGHNLPTGTATATVIIKGETYNTTVWQRHPNYNASNLTNGYDVCVVRLDRRVKNAKPLKIYTGTSEGGKNCWIVGHGRTGTGTTGVQSGNLARRAGTNVVDMDPSLPNIMLTDFDQEGNALMNSLSSLGSSATATQYESNLVSGDSGGALLIQENGVWKVAGINSAVASVDGTANGSYGDLSIFTRVSKAAAWIQPRLWENGRVEGTLELESYMANPLDIPATFEIRAPGTTTPLETHVVPLACDAGFSFSTNLRGTYDIAVKAPGYLRKVWRNLVITNNDPAPLTRLLLNGDVDNDNEVGSSDLGAISESFLSAVGDSNYNVAADLDGDGEIGSSDLSVLGGNFLLRGED